MLCRASKNQRIENKQSSSNTKVTGIKKLQQYFFNRSRGCKDCTDTNIRPYIHVGSLFIFLFAITALILLNISTIQPSRAATVIWDGEGTSESCGIGAEEYWSCGKNWSGDSAPGSNDIVKFDNTSTKNSLIDLGHNGQVAGVIIESGYTGTITIDMTNELQTSGDYTQSGGTLDGNNTSFDCNGDFTLNGGEFIAPSMAYFAGEFDWDSGTFTHSNGIMTFDGNNTSTLFDVPSSGTFAFLTVNRSASGGGIAPDGSDTITIASDLSLTNGKILGSSNATIEIQGNFVLDAGFDGGDGALVKWKTVNMYEPSFPAGTKVPRFELDSANVTISTIGEGVITYDSALTLTNGQIAVVNNEVIFSDLVVMADGTFTVGVYDIDFPYGFTMTSGTFTSGFINNFKISNSSAFTMSGGSFTAFNTGGMDLNGDFNLTGGSFTAPAGTTYIAGNWTFTTGTFDNSWGTITFDGLDQSISGETTFYGFSKTATTTVATSTLTLPASVTTTIDGLVTLKGIVNSSTLLLRSSQGGTQALLDLPDEISRIIEYVDVKDNNNVDAAAVDCSTGCINSGNNTNWDFPNATPTIDSIFFTTTTGSSVSSSDFNLVELSTTTGYIRGSFTDMDGCEDVATNGSAEARTYRSGVAACTSASTDPINCYHTTSCSFSSCSGSGDNTGEFECPIDFYHFADATHGGGDYTSESWVVEATLKDATSTEDIASSTFEMNSLTALNVGQTVDYGLLSLGATSSEIGLIITNTGNIALDTYVSGENMTCSQIGSIAAGTQKYASSSGQGYSNMTQLTNSSTLVGINLIQQTTTSTLSTTTYYWMLQAPANGVLGQCMGTTTMVGTESAGP